MLESYVAFAIIIVYTLTAVGAILYITHQIYKIQKDTSHKLKNHRLEHIKLGLLLVFLNVAMIGTNLTYGWSVFMSLMITPGNPISFQFILMTLFIFISVSHLNEEIVELEGK